ncbi:MAG TPA: hypothetical protein DCM45_01745, partial [Clostridiales bacterium]|nr:hypothetical protein [Clostridiales bacterium]
VPTMTEPPLPDPALSADELQWIGIGVLRTDILTMYYEGSNIVDYRDLPIPESFAIEGGGSAAFEFTSSAHPDDFEAFVFATKITMTDKTGQAKVIDTPANVGSAEMAVRIGDFILPVSYADEQTVLYADLIKSLGEPPDQSDSKTGAGSEWSLKIAGTIRIMNYDALKVVLFQPDTLAGTDRWFCMELRVSANDLDGPGGIRCGMSRQETVHQLSSGAFQYATLYDWNGDSWIAFAKGQISSQNKIAAQMWLRWENGQLAEMIIILQGGAFGSMG